MGGKNAYPNAAIWVLVAVEQNKRAFPEIFLKKIKGNLFPFDAVFRGCFPCSDLRHREALFTHPTALCFQRLKSRFERGVSPNVRFSQYRTFGENKTGETERLLSAEAV